MIGLICHVRLFADSKRAVAAIEFAMIMPVLLLLFLGSWDAGNAIAVYAKVRAATYSLAAITDQYGDGTNPNYSPISTSTMSTITTAAAAILQPYPSAPVTVVVSQIRANSATAAVVSWSYSPTAGSALTQGNSYSLPTNFAANSCNGTYPCYFILGSVSYVFTPMFGAFLTGPITLSDSLYTTPRVSTCVVYNSTPTSCLP
jgi:Flp pilus assembly protein TadG